MTVQKRYHTLAEMTEACLQFLSHQFTETIRILWMACTNHSSGGQG